MKKIKDWKERFWEKVNKTENCWLWTAAISPKGYGTFSYNGKSHQSHRIAWIIIKGPIPDGLCVLHDCPDGDNPACCNPDHLFLGTIDDNNKDKAKKGRGFSVAGEDHWATKLNSIYPTAKLKEEDVLEIRKNYSKKEDLYSMAEKYNVTKTTIYHIVERKTWKWLK